MSPVRTAHTNRFCLLIGQVRGSGVQLFQKDKGGGDSRKAEEPLGMEQLVQGNSFHLWGSASGICTLGTCAWEVCFRSYLWLISRGLETYFLKPCQASAPFWVRMLHFLNQAGLGSCHTVSCHGMLTLFTISGPAVGKGHLYFWPICFSSRIHLTK